MASVWAIRRSATDRKVSGVCGGVARHWGVDPVLVRVGCALLALSGGFGVMLYVAAWLLIPLDGRNRSILLGVLGHRAHRWPREVWVVLVGLGALVAFTAFANLAPFGLGPAVILALVWYFGYSRPRQVRAERDRATPLTPPGTMPPYVAPDTPLAQASEAQRQQVEEAQRESLASSAFFAVADPVGLYGEAASVAVPRPTRGVSRARSRPARQLRLVCLIVLGLVLSGLGLVERSGVAVGPAVYLAAALLVLGLTLVAAAFVGRARGILPVALLVLGATIASAVTGPVATQQGWGDQRVTYASPDELASGASRHVGRLRVDLTRLNLQRATSYDAHVGLGVLEVSVPADANLVVRYAVTAGAVTLDGREVGSGADLHGVLSPASDPRRPTLLLNLSVDHGLVQVRR